MQTSVETINGKLCTVIKRPFDAEWVREQLAMGIPVVVEHVNFGIQFVRLCFKNGQCVTGGKIKTGWTFAIEDKFIPKHTITILPALPRRPTPEHAPLFHRYASEGITIIGQDNKGQMMSCWLAESYYGWSLDVWHPYHATDTNGNRTEIAIEKVCDGANDTTR